MSSRRLKLENSEAPQTAPANDTDAAWLKIAKDAYERSTTYFENNFRRQWEDGLRMFQGKHPRDSKYNSEAYKYRSKVFRPKSRSISRKIEATASVAFFSSNDVVSVSPVSPGNAMQAWSSKLMKEVLAYRLDKTIPWYLTVMGGVQDATNVGLVASFQYWKYRSKTEMGIQTGYHPQFGQVQFQAPKKVVIQDEPCVELIPIENIRFDPAATWSDVVGTSPYLIIQMPMYLRDVLDHMETQDRTGKPWRSYGKEVILEARVDSSDGLRQARNEMKEDPQQQTSEVNEFDVIMVHLNFVRVGEEDFAFYTLMDKHLLTDPVPLKEMFFHNERPVVIGFMVVETHKAVPTSPILLGKDLQTEANEIANQRLDNVKFVLNKRWFVRRGSNIDTDSMTKNVPGGVTMVNNVETDVKESNWNDVTSSAFQEQDRINVDYDELLGNFAQSSVMTNRRLNETVGGMKIMAQGANVVTEYSLRILAETWIEPTLRQLMLLEQHYETDEVILAIAGDKAKLFQKFGMSPDWDRLLSQELTLAVDVGMGATDPGTRFQRFIQVFGAYSQLAQGGTPDINLVELRRELFELAGFKDSERFFAQADPRLLQAKKMLENAKQIAAQEVDKQRFKLMLEDNQLNERDRDLDAEENEMRREDLFNDAMLQIERKAFQREKAKSNGGKSVQ